LAHSRFTLDYYIFSILHVEVNILISAIKRLAVAWLALVSLTLLSFEARALPNNMNQIFNLAILIISFFKVRIVSLEFMEIRHAHLLLRAIVEGWIWLTLLILILVIAFDVVLFT
jgi:hypothetical protein